MDGAKAVQGFPLSGMVGEATRDVQRVPVQRFRLTEPAAGEQMSVHTGRKPPAECDHYGQSKDLLDAALLAEYTTVCLDLVRKVLRMAPSDTEVEPDGFMAASVLRWKWTGSRGMVGAAARALDQSFAA